MPMTSSLLDPLSLPDYAALTPEAIGKALDQSLADMQAVVARIVAEKPRDFDTAWLPLEQADTAMDALWSAVSHLKSVANTPELREAHAAGEQRIVETMTAVFQDHELYEVIAALESSPDFAQRSPADRAAVEHMLRSFRLSGVALPPEQRARFAEVSVELAGLANAFSAAVLDATDAWSEHVTDAALLAGIPDAAMGMFAANAKAKGLEGWVVTLQWPSVNAVLTFAQDRGLRQRVYTAFGTRASDQGPNAGAFDNTQRITRILELRRESAALLGFADPVELSLATKMAPNAGEVLHFLRDLAKRARPGAERDLADAREFAAQELGIADLQPWDLTYTANAMKLARFAVDEQEVRAYFPVERVLAGWQVLLGRLFGITLKERTDVALWHEDARYYDVADEDGAVIAGLYLDLHARQGKQGGAWMAQARPRLADGGSARVPVAYLTCNFAPKGGETPSLLSHTEVETLLHETGHCLHHLFTRVNRPSVAGTSGFEWDAVELPSQLMEDFAWDREVLTGMSGHHRTGEPLPADLFEKMLAARRFQSGLFVLRQIEFGLFDLLLHLGTMGSDPMEVIGAVREEVAVVIPPEWHRFPHSFTHVFSGGYASGYYSYLWAEVLAADGFRKFVEAGVVDRATGDAFRDEVLARGATRPAADSFRAFRGRDADVTALLERRGLLA
ncbi:M3 family metallopeptidase [Novosphingobium sp. BL-8A]|uniref:M3 family metallopeptidase n=1 Tax=Novosphingobium sp. BL-8A TaxID=3127639 RepID=UPI0037574682